LKLLKVNQALKAENMQLIVRFFKAHWKRVFLILLLVGCFFAFRQLGWNKFLDFSYVKAQRAALRNYVVHHYWASVAAFIGIYMTTALFVPGAIVLNMAGGFLFGVMPTALYVNAGATSGSFLALLVSRHMLGTWLQERYAQQLQPLNRALERQGVSYLLAVRIIPVLPFFTVNYLVGLTRVPLKTFLWTTSLGMFPGSLIYAYAGLELGSINRPEDILSPRILSVLALIGIFILLPPIISILKRLRKRP
jgi:uncharacterized membrane protein YdjX (TVP38/TMEM64 family)